MRTDLGPSRAKAAATTLRADVIEGLRWLWQHELLRPLAVAVALVNLGVSAIGALLVLFAVDVLGLPAVGYGFLIGVGAAGGLLGTLIAGPVVARFGRTASMAVAAGIAGASMLTLALAPSAVVAGRGRSRPTPTSTDRDRQADVVVRHGGVLRARTA